MRGMSFFQHRFVILFLSAATLLAIGCGKGAAPATSIPGDTGSAEKPNLAADVGPVQLTADPNPGNSPARPPINQHPEVLLRTSLGDIKVRLDSERAPETVDNFLANYLERGFYDGTVFHYVDQGFMIAAGGYAEGLTPKETRPKIRNEAHNGLKNRRGTIAMARHPDEIHGSTSQFFFNLVDNPSLDHQGQENLETYGYCVFGEVVEGWDVVEKIAATPVADTDSFPKTPRTPVVIRQALRLN